MTTQNWQQVLPPQAVTTQHGELTTTSLKIAEAFGKRHDDVLRRIRSINCSPEFNARNFAGVEYLDSKGERRPMYELTRNGFFFMVMGFTGKKAERIREAYINAFDDMERQLQQRAVSQQNLVCLASHATEIDRIWRAQLQPALISLQSPARHELHERILTAAYIGRQVLANR
ncbi:Rha family transcriptional regulator [Oceanobacter mangrovi]|uniref:Rha family transcriptional regulator n=1 Tax=Oceanobacter mangrovi TaxID=2862510 RepID=UPI001C8DC9C4|nr:Rha family transcriptional regulator [Oceanobacter mangrovi]